MQCLNTISCKQGAIRAIRFNVDGAYCLSCGSDNKVKLWNPYKGLLLKTYGGHGDEVWDAVGSCDSSQIVSCSLDKSIILWDVGTAQALRRFRVHASGVSCVQLNEESTMAVSGARDNCVMCWDLRSRRQEPVQVLRDAQDCITSLHVVDSDILAGSVDCRVRRYDIRNGAIVSDFLGAAVTSARFTNDSQCFIAGCTNNVVLLIDKLTGEMLQEFTGHKVDDLNIEVAINRSDTKVMSGSADGYVYCWELLTGKVLEKYEHTAGRAVCSINAHPTLDIFLSASQGNFKLWGAAEDIKTQMET